MDSSRQRTVNETMSHLPTERLAALVDETPTAAERLHLEACGSCREERLAHERVHALAADERLRLAPPLTSWDALAPRLRDEGLVRDARRARHIPARLARIAAVLLVGAGGLAAGRWSAGAPVLPIAGPDSAEVADAGNGGVLTPVADRSFATTQEALGALAAAQREYERAAAFLAAHDTAGAPRATPDVYRARLAAIDGVAAASLAALNEAPEDPVINQYYLTALNAREATLRQLGTTLPDGSRLTRF